MSDYHPIACARHEALELAILRRRWLRLVVAADPAAPASAGALLALPLDIGAADGAEWLLVRDADGVERRLRLDQLLDAAPAEAPD